jgi:hypothetical protein
MFVSGLDANTYSLELLERIEQIESQTSQKTGLPPWKYTFCIQLILFNFRNAGPHNLEYLHNYKL